MREILEEIKSAAESGMASSPLSAERLAGLIALVSSGVISNSAGREVFKEMVKSGDPAAKVVERLGLTQVSGANELEQWVADVIAANPDEVARYKGGKTQLLGFFVGQVMKQSAGKANPKLTGEIVKKMLEG